MTSRYPSDNDSNLRSNGTKTMCAEKHTTRESGNAALWIMAAVVLVIVALALFMGRGRHSSREQGSPAQKQVHEQAQQDTRTREHVRVQKPEGRQRRPDRAHRPPPPGARRPEGGPSVPPHDPRARKRALQSRYDAMRPADGKGDVRGDQQEGIGLEADVSGTPDQASPS